MLSFDYSLHESFPCNFPAFTRPTSSPDLISQTVTIVQAGKAGQMGQGRATPSGDEKRLLGDFEQPNDAVLIGPPRHPIRTSAMAPSKGTKRFQPVNTLRLDSRRPGVTFDLSDRDARRPQFKRSRPAAEAVELDPIEIESGDDHRAGKRQKAGMERVPPAMVTSRETKEPAGRPLLDPGSRHGSNPSCHVEDIGKMLLSSVPSDGPNTWTAMADEEEDEALAGRGWQGTANLRPSKGGQRPSCFQSMLQDSRMRSNARVAYEDACRLSKSGNGPKPINQRWTRAQSPAALSQQPLLDAQLSRGARARGAPPSPKISEIQKAAPRQRPERQTLHAGRAIDDPNDASIPTGIKPGTTVDPELVESVPDSVSTRGDIAPTQFRAKGRDRLERRALEDSDPPGSPFEPGKNRPVADGTDSTTNKRRRTTGDRDGRSSPAKLKHRLLPQDNSDTRGGRPAKRYGTRSQNVTMTAANGGQAREARSNDMPTSERSSPPLTKTPRPAEWTESVVYPSDGPRKAAVDWVDLDRLEDGEFLNDNIISFYSRYLEHQLEQSNPDVARRVYIFNTFFYDRLTKNARGRKGINYDAVSKWTSKVDIFDYDYVIVPINENAHWYLAIICNLPNLVKSGSVSASDVIDLDAAEARGTSRFFAAAGEAKCFPSASDSHGVELHGAGHILSNAPKPGGRPGQTSVLSANGAADLASLLQQHYSSPSEKLLRTESSEIQQQDHPSASKSVSGTLSLASPLSPSFPTDASTGGDVFVATILEESKSETATTAGASKTKAAFPRAKRFDVHEPAIITLDSLGFQHAATARHLKAYLVQEAQRKRQVDIQADDISSLAAKGLPEQSNYCDCGLFLLGYLDRFFENPPQLIKPLLQREALQIEEWPIDPKRMRTAIRDILIRLSDEQAEVKKLARQQHADSRGKAHGKESISSRGTSSPAVPGATTKTEGQPHAAAGSRAADAVPNDLPDVSIVTLSSEGAASSGKKKRKRRLDLTIDDGRPRVSSNQEHLPSPCSVSEIARLGTDNTGHMPHKASTGVGADSLPPSKRAKLGSGEFVMLTSEDGVLSNREHRSSPCPVSQIGRLGANDAGHVLRKASAGVGADSSPALQGVKLDSDELIMLTSRDDDPA